MLIAVTLVGGMFTLSTPASAQTSTSPSSDGPLVHELEAQIDATQAEANSGPAIPGWVKKVTEIVGSALDAFGITNNGQGGKIAGVVGSIIDLVNGDTGTSSSTSAETPLPSRSNLPPTREVRVGSPTVQSVLGLSNALRGR
jgi:hypothetical protein